MNKKIILKDVITNKKYVFFDQYKAEWFIEDYENLNNLIDISNEGDSNYIY